MNIRGRVSFRQVHYPLGQNHVRQAGEKPGVGFRLVETHQFNIFTVKHFLHKGVIGGANSIITSILPSIIAFLEATRAIQLKNEEAGWLNGSMIFGGRKEEGGGLFATMARMIVGPIAATTLPS